MISPISSPHNADVHAPEKPAPKSEPQTPTPKGGALSHDQVTLKSAGEVDCDSGEQ